VKDDSLTDLILITEDRMDSRKERKKGKKEKGKTIEIDSANGAQKNNLLL